MKILCFGDFHIGHSTYGQVDPVTGLNTRVLSALNVLDEIIAYAIKKKIKLVVFAGDAYKNVTVSDTVQYEFNKRIAEAAEKGIQFILLDGNHDVSTMEQYKSPLAQFSAMKVKNVFHTRFHEEFIYEQDREKIKFVTIPTYHTQDEVKKIVENTTYDGFPIVYIMHGTIRGALLNDWLIEEKETYVEAEVFDKEGVAAVVLAHLHKHQIMYNRPLVFYTGSTNRIDFTEEKQEKGFVHMTIEPDGMTTYDFIEVNSIKFTTLKDNVIGSNDPTEQILELLNKNAKKVKDSILRIRIDIEKTTVFSEKKIYELAYELGASYVLDLQKKLEVEKTVRVAGLNEHVTEEQALELYYQDKENKEEFIKYGKEIINLARASGKI